MSTFTWLSMYFLLFLFFGRHGPHYQQKPWESLFGLSTVIHFAGSYVPYLGVVRILYRGASPVVAWIHEFRVEYLLCVDDVRDARGVCQ